MTRKCVLALLGLAALALSVVSAASAEPPTRTFVGATPVSGPFCPGFDVLVTPVFNKEYAITFSNGAVIIEGPSFSDVTNLSNGKTIEINSSGPGFFSADGSTLTAPGAQGIFLPAGALSPGSPPVSQLLSGVLVVDLATGAISETGHIRDLCAEIA
jgi:hypothetical protein